MLGRRQFAQLAGSALVTAACGGARQLGRDARQVTAIVPGRATRDGAGVQLTRLLGHRGVPMVDPFLMLDEIRSRDPADYLAGFPRHPHRGFETVSILLSGTFQHRDTLGNHGTIAGGDLQWMTAGHGIVHEELPRAAPGEELWGLQLWVNLPARDKLMTPRYQDLAATSVTHASCGDAQARVLAGQVGRTRGPVDGIVTRPTLLDLTVPAGGRLHHELPRDHAALLVVLEGQLAIGPRAQLAGAREVAVLGPGRDVTAASPGGARALLIAGTPLGEPVARRGPFVMTSEAELDEAEADYRSGRLTTL